jgi:hypothetical protein
MENQKTELSLTPSPIWEIPDIWVKNGHCPACGATNLKVIHLPDHADYLSCEHCEVSFEVETGGKNIRLKSIPDEYGFADAVLHNCWVEASNLASIISERRALFQEKKNSSSSAPMLYEEDAWHRALGMYHMGNKPKMIQLSLLQSGMAQEEAGVIFEKLITLAKQDAERQNQKFWSVAGISLFLIILAAGSWLYVSGNLSILFGAAPVTPASVAVKPSVVERLLDLVPEGAKPALLNLPDTTVTNSGPEISACPSTAAAAARLFGGTPALWKKDASQFTSWQMISTGDSVTVRVPNGMVAGYVDNKSFKLLSVHGPATINNVNFVAITCD